MPFDHNRNVGRTDLPGELGSVSAPRETDPTPAVTRPGARPASAMVTRTRAREGRGMNTEPEMVFRPEVEFRQEMDIPAETCEEGLGAARPFTTDIASQYLTDDKPEVTAIFTSQEVTSSFPIDNTQTAAPHNSISSFVEGTFRFIYRELECPWLNNKNSQISNNIGPRQNVII